MGEPGPCGEQRFQAGVPRPGQGWSRRRAERGAGHGSAPHTGTAARFIHSEENEIRGDAGLGLKLHRKAESLGVTCRCCRARPGGVRSPEAAQGSSMVGSHALFYEAGFKEGVKCYSSCSGYVNSGSVYMKMFVGETEGLCFVVNYKDPLSTGFFPMVIIHS